MIGGSLRFLAIRDVTQPPGEHGRPRCNGCLRPARRAAELTARTVLLHPYRRGTPGGCSRDSRGLLASAGPMAGSSLGDFARSQGAPLRRALSLQSGARAIAGGAVLAAVGESRGVETSPVFAIIMNDRIQPRRPPCAASSECRFVARGSPAKSPPKMDLTAVPHGAALISAPMSGFPGRCTGSRCVPG
jgi:hypothetical protein